MTTMVCPGVVRKVGKLVPTILQALALVVCIHVVGQVICLREIPDLIFVATAATGGRVKFLSVV